MRLLEFILLFALAISFSYSIEPELVIDDEQLAQKFLKSSLDFEDLIFSHRKVTVDSLSNLLNEENQLSKNCSDSLHVLRNGLDERKFWAYKFLDASGHSQSGLAAGYISSLGSIDQCTEIRQPHAKQFFGKYCLVSLKFPNLPPQERNFNRPLKLNVKTVGLQDSIYEHFANYTELFHHHSHTFALCAPSTCSRDEITFIAKFFLKGRNLDAEVIGDCYVHQSMYGYAASKSWPEIVSLCIVIAIGIVVILATVFSAKIANNSWLNHFNAIRNTRKLTTPYKSAYMQKLQFFDTFKFYYHSCALLAHMVCFMPIIPYAFPVMQDLSNYEESQWLLSEYAKRAIYTTQLAFVMSGCFSCYYFLPLLEKNKGKLNFWSYAFKRWLRTTPTTIAIIVSMFAFGTILRGPIADDLLEQHLGNCRRGWWKTILNINNYQPMNDICIPTSWTQSVDFHCWLLAYFPLIWLAQSPKKGIASCLVLIALGMVVPAILMGVYQLPPTLSGRPMDMVYFIMRGNYFPTMHLATHNNISAYFLGTLLGYCFAKQIRPKNVLTLIALGNACIYISIASIYAPYVWTNLFGLEMGSTANAIYGGTFRVLYLLMFSAVFYMQFFVANVFANMVPGYSTIINSKFYLPFGRLAYSVYIAQVIPMAIYFCNNYEKIPNNIYSMLYKFFPIMIFCWIFGYFVYLLFEGPVVSAVKGLNDKLDVNSNVEEKKVE